MQSLAENGILLPMDRLVAGLERLSVAPQLLMAATLLMLLLSLWIVKRAARSRSGVES